MSERQQSSEAGATTEFRLLNSIEFPADLRLLPPERLPRLAQELRSFLIDTVSRTGG
ncbi:MAG: hypothetical protein OQL28_12620, partial [Sedimenticola sp.]|nr:hypothetical protein [Sedimenticola sp.]